MWKRTFKLLTTAVRRWLGDNSFRFGAALAYYTVFSLAPLVLISLSVAGVFFGEEQAQEEMLRQINDTVGPQVGDAIKSVSHYAAKSGGGTLATIIGVIVLLFGASSVFAQLQDALNTIWGVQSAAGITWITIVKNRLLSFAAVLGTGFLLLVSLVLSAGLSALANFMTPDSLPGGAYLWQGLNWLFSFTLIAVLFALIYKLLPDVEIEWEDVWIGAAATSLLFAVGKYLIGLYLGRSSWISAYGAAGSLVVVLLWVYYSSQIFLLGAEFTYVYANETGKPLRPKKHAEAVSDEAIARQESESQAKAEASG